MKDKDKTKAELLKELEILQEEREKGVFKDIAECKQAKEAMQESENRFRELFNNMNSKVAVYDAKDNGRDFIIKDFNYSAEKIEKIKKEDIIGKSVLKVFPGVKDLGLFKVFQEVYKTGKPQYHPISFYRDQRITGWRENYVYKLSSGEIVAVYDDVTECKQAVESLQESEAKYRAVLEQSADNIFLVDLETKKILESNVSLRNLLGYSADEMKKLTVYDFVAQPKDEIKKKLEQLRKQDKTVIRE